MSITIRPLTEVDSPQWQTYWSQYNTFYKRTVPDAVTATTLARFLDPDVQMFCAVAEEDHADSQGGKRIIGFVTWFPHPSTSLIGPSVYLNDLFVDPEIRTKGVGGKLIDHVYEHAKEVLGAEMVYWLTQHFNHAAQLLYVKKANKSDFVHYSKNLADL